MSTLLLVLVACLGTTDPVEEIVAEEEVEIAAPEPEAPAPLPRATEPKYAATQVLIAWEGAVRAPPGVDRGEAEAQHLAEAIHARALAGEDLEDLARTYSDGPAGPRGGQLGVYLTGTMVPDFESAVASVEVGEIAPPVRTPFGWHVPRRDRVREAEVSHIMVSWEGAWRSESALSRDAARARIEEAARRLEAGEDFAALARSLSEDPSAQEGGRLGAIAPGQTVPAFEEAVFALEPGERSGVVETPYGFHLVVRHR